MKKKKLILIVIFIVLFGSFLFSDPKKNFNFNNIYFNSRSSNSIKIKSLLSPSIYTYTKKNTTIDNLFYLKNSFKKIINKTYSIPEPDIIIIFTFINSLYYLIKFKINLWAYNQSIFSENNNKIKPYFNINLKSKIINVGFDINL